MTIKEFEKINRSFNRKLVFRIGIGAGFFSEYNNMVLSIHYCLMNEIQFILNSKGANFSNSQGWSEYFLPFCREDYHFLHKTFNCRYEKPMIRGRDKLKYLVYQSYLLNNNIDLLTYEIFHKARIQQLNKTYELKRLGLYGDLRENCCKINNMVWKYRPQIQNEIDKLRKELNILKPYIGFHLRRGDKSTETGTDSISIHEFIKIAELKSESKTAFIASDDYSVIEQLKSNYSNWTFYTLTEPKERGYIQSQHEIKSSHAKRNALIKLFTTIELLSNSELFIGTITSNIGFYMGWRLKPEKIIYVDYAEWKIW